MKKVLRKVSNRISNTLVPKYEVYNKTSTSSVVFYGSERRAKLFVKSNPAGDFAIRREPKRGS